MKKNNTYLIFISIFILFFSNVSFSSSNNLKMSFTNAPLHSVVDTVSLITNKNYTFSAEASQVPLSVKMPSNSSPDAVYNAFLQSLSVSGLKAVEVRQDLVVIVPIDTNTDQSVNLKDSSFFTKVFILKNPIATDLSASLKSLLTTGGYIEPSGDYKLVLTDTSSKVNLFSTLIKQLDIFIDPIITETLILNNIAPSTINFPKELQVYAYDKLSRLSVKGARSDVLEFKKSVYELDRSVKTVYVNLLIATMTKGFSQEFNIVSIFQRGTVSLALSSSGLNLSTLNPANDALSILANFFQTKSDVTIQAKPFLQLLEGNKASFNVGREVPILISTIDQNTGQSIRNIERKKVGLSVELLARVRPDGKIHLDLSQNLSSISDFQIEGGSDIITDDQSLQTQLLLSPDTVYVVGGLTDNRTINSRTGLPFLSFLDSKSNSNQTQEIMIFIETSLTKFSHLEEAKSREAL